MRLKTEVPHGYTHAKRSYTHVKDALVAYENNKITWHATESVTLQNVEVGQYMEEEENW